MTRLRYEVRTSHPSRLCGGGYRDATPVRSRSRETAIRAADRIASRSDAYARTRTLPALATVGVYDARTGECVYEPERLVQSIAERGVW